MANRAQPKIAFNGVRIEFDSARSFEPLVAALFADIGDEAVAAGEIAAKFVSWDTYETELKNHPDIVAGVDLGTSAGGAARGGEGEDGEETGWMVTPMMMSTRR